MITQLYHRLTVLSAFSLQIAPPQITPKLYSLRIRKQSAEQSTTEEQKIQVEVDKKLPAEEQEVEPKTEDKEATVIIPPSVINKSK